MAKKRKKTKKQQERLARLRFYAWQIIVVASLLYVLFPWAPNPKAAESPVIQVKTTPLTEIEQCKLDVATKALNTSLPESDKLNPCVIVPVPAPASATKPIRPVVPVMQVTESVPEAVALGRQLAAARGWTGIEWDSLYLLWMRESGWNPMAVNRSSGACGIPQALPCSKIPDKSTVGQINWGLDYIQRRYGTPLNAMAHWQQKRWY